MDTMDERTKLFVEAYSEDPSSWGFLFSSVSVASFLLTLSITLVVSPAVNSLVFSSKYHSLGSSKRTFDTYLTSSVHAVTVSGMALYLLAFGMMGTDTLTRVYSKEPLGFAVMQIALGYFLADLLVSLCDPKLRSDKGSLLHHLAGISAVVLGLVTQGKYMCFIVVFFITELSTPFVNLFHVSRHMSDKGSGLHLSASLAMLVSFFLCRVAIIPWRWYVMTRTVLHPASEHIVRYELRITILVHYAILDVLNIYWLYRMLLGGLKLIRNHGKRT